MRTVSPAKRSRSPEPVRDRDGKGWQCRIHRGNRYVPLDSECLIVLVRSWTLKDRRIAIPIREVFSSTGRLRMHLNRGAGRIWTGSAPPDHGQPIDLGWRRRRCVRDLVERSAFQTGVVERGDREKVGVPSLRLSRVAVGIIARAAMR
jgi:hypothetical protein